MASLVLIGVGAWDDRAPLPALLRIAIQCLVTYWVVAYGGMVVESLGTFPIIGELRLGPLAEPFTVLVTVGLMNALNMLDGLDGLLGGVVMAILGVLGLAALTGGAQDYGQLALVVLTAVAAFYIYNFRWPGRNRALVFLGDAGSTWLGLTLAWLAIGISHTTPAALDKAAVAWVLALPVLDTLSTIALRLSKGKHPMEPGHEHIHFVLRDHGVSVNATVLLVTGLTAVMGLVGLGMARIGLADYWILTAFLLLFILYAESIQHLRRLGSWFGWLLPKGARERSQGPGA
ncbi:hypothetical protein AN478_10515 [Thiohalorhabdus denitrificans]|nr:MraY family glycosyltransferase [Thiohalorhabdus denitrificans]KPV39566.1 hypothetical protein AN478_10515 [Thiohalorhabdus denitrificans]